MKNFIILILTLSSINALTTKIKATMKSKAQLQAYMKIKIKAREKKLFKSLLAQKQQPQQDDTKLLDDGDMQFTNEQLQDLIKEFQGQLSKQTKSNSTQNLSKQDTKQDSKLDRFQKQPMVTNQPKIQNTNQSNQPQYSKQQQDQPKQQQDQPKQQQDQSKQQQDQSKQQQDQQKQQILQDQLTKIQKELDQMKARQDDKHDKQNTEDLQKRFKRKQNDDQDEDKTDPTEKAKQEAEKKKEEKLKTMSDDQKAQEYPNDFYWEYPRSEERIQSEKDLNSVAQQKFIESPQGSDNYKPIGLLKDGDMGLILSYTYRDDNDPNIKFHHLMLNDRNLFFLKEEASGYRGVLGAIKISSLYNKKIDDVRFGQCCESIGIVKSKLIGDLNSQQEYQCFQVDDHVDKQSWQICSNDGQEASDWRQTLIMQVILYGLRSFGIYGLDQLMKFQKQACLKPTGWSYEFQSRWPCMCPEGMLQSPIDIDPTKTVDCQVCQLFPKYEITTSIVLLHQSWETLAEGEFGRTYYRNKKRKRSSWKSQSLRFKFPAEHLVNGTQYPGEMQVFHTDGENRMAFSVFITNDPSQLSIEKAVAQEKEGEAVENTAVSTDMEASDFFKEGDNQKLETEAQEKGDEFINQFMFDEWQERQPLMFGTEQCIEAKINITKVFDAASTFSYSFFSYQGSDSEPPCNEDVQWIVMKDRVLLSTQVFNRLKEKVIGKDNPKPNAREVMPLENRDVVSHDECKKFVYPSPEPGPPLDAQYVKSKATLNYYAIVYPKTRTIFDNENNALELVKGKDHKIKLEYINEDQMRKISPKITQDLRFQLGEWLVNNRDKIMQRKMSGLDEKYGKDNVDGEMDTNKPDI